MKFLGIIYIIFAVHAQNLVNPICIKSNEIFIDATEPTHYQDQAICPHDRFLNTISYDMLPTISKHLKGKCLIAHARKRDRECQVTKFPEYFTESVFFPTLIFQSRCNKTNNEVLSGLQVLIDKFKIEFDCGFNMGLVAFNLKNFTCCSFRS